MQICQVGARTVPIVRFLMPPQPVVGVAAGRARVQSQKNCHLIRQFLSPVARTTLWAHCMCGKLLRQDPFLRHHQANEYSSRLAAGPRGPHGSHMGWQCKSSLARAWHNNRSRRRQLFMPRCLQVGTIHSRTVAQLQSFLQSHQLMFESSLPLPTQL